MAILFDSNLARDESEDLFFSSDDLPVPESTRTVLEPYHRFYTMVRNSLFHESESRSESTQQILPFEEWIRNNELVDKLTDDTKTELKRIWRRAERLDELQIIVGRFNRHNLDLHCPRNSSTEDSSKPLFANCDNPWQQISAKLDELLYSQKRIEQKVAVSRTPDPDSTMKESVGLDQEHKTLESPSESDPAIEFAIPGDTDDQVESHTIPLDFASDNGKESRKKIDDFSEEEEEEEQLEFLSNKTESFFLESEQDSGKVFTIRPQFVTQENRSIHDSSPTEKQLSVSLRRLDDLASATKPSFVNYTQNEAVDLFKDEFCHDIWKVQENIFGSNIENFTCCFMETRLDKNSAHVHENELGGKAHGMCSLSSNSELNFNECEQLNSLIV
eukprot:g4142.t1